MPRIVKSHGVTISEDVFKVGDNGLAERESVTRTPSKPMEISENPGKAEPFVIQEHRLASLQQEEQIEEEEAIHPMQQQLIQNAMDEATRILEEAVEQSTAHKAEVLAQARYEAEKMKQEAVEEGKREGMTLVAEEVRQMVSRLEGAISRFEGDRAGFEREYEDGLKWMALEIASKVLAKRVSADDGEMLQMVEKAVHTVEREPWVRVEVAQEMTSLLGKLESVFKEYENIDVSPMPIQAGDILIETPSGVIDVSVSTQLENLKNYFRKQGR